MVIAPGHGRPCRHATDAARPATDDAPAGNAGWFAFLNIWGFSQLKIWIMQAPPPLIFDQPFMDDGECAV